MRRSNRVLAIPVSVIVVTKNEETRIERCLESLSMFDDIWVVDSMSEDATCDIAQKFAVHVERFSWDGGYPKKRQWCLDTLSLANDWVLFIDADEVLTQEAAVSIAALFDGGAPVEAGFFIRANYIWQGEMLRHGLKNSKLVLFDRRRVEFPVVDDLGLVGMGEIEGHYQPVLKAEYAADKIGVLDAQIIHDACDDRDAWEERHKRYAMWEAGMNARHAWPDDPVKVRQCLKTIFRSMPFRDVAAFLHCFVLRLGFFDGGAGMDFACSRARYYRMIRDAQAFVSGANKD